MDDERGMRESIAAVCAILIQRYPAIDAREIEATYLRVSEEAWRSADGVVSEFTLRDLRVELWGKALASHGLPGRPLALEAADLYGEESRGHCHPFPDARNVLDALHRKVILGVITNGPGDTQRAKLAVGGLLDSLDIVFSSGDLGVGKPDPAIFREAMEQAGVTPGQVLHVGDSLAADIAGAQAAGIAGVWINRRGVPRPPDAPEPDVEISSLRELIAFVDLPE